MAKERRTQEQRDVVAAFVNRLAAIHGGAHNVDFADDAGLYDSNVSEYRSGKAVPDGYNLILMIRAALGDEQAVLDAAAGSPSRVARPVPRQGLRATVSELLQWQETVIGDLGELDRRLEQLESERGSRRGKGVNPA